MTDVFLFCINRANLFFGKLGKTSGCGPNFNGFFFGQCPVLPPHCMEIPSVDFNPADKQPANTPITISLREVWNLQPLTKVVLDDFPDKFTLKFSM